MSTLTSTFMLYALLAGTGVGAACGLIGYFAVLRAQVFLGDALSHVAFVGALAALLLGIGPQLGLLATTVVAGVVLGLLGSSARAGRAEAAQDTVIGSLFAWFLGLGALLLSLYASSATAAGNSRGGVSVLFGSILGLSAGQAWAALGVGVLVCVLGVALARPVLFSTLDGAVAAARGVPVRLVAVAFAGLMGLCAAEATQTIGSLLLLGLIAAPGGAARALTANPYRGLAISAAVAVVSVWAGLVLSAFIPQLPPSTAIVAVAAACFAGAQGVARIRARRRGAVSGGTSFAKAQAHAHEHAH